MGADRSRSTFSLAAGRRGGARAREVRKPAGCRRRILRPGRRFGGPMLNLVSSCSVPNGALSRAIFRWTRWELDTRRCGTRSSASPPDAHRPRSLPSIAARLSGSIASTEAGGKLPTLQRPVGCELGMANGLARQLWGRFLAPSKPNKPKRPLDRQSLVQIRIRSTARRCSARSRRSLASSISSRSSQ